MAKKKTPDGEKVEVALPFKLDDEQKARKAEGAGSLNKTLEAAQEAKKSEMVKHNGKIKDLQKKLSAQLKMINEGIERRVVSCTRVKNFEKNMVEYWFEGEMLEEIEMKPGDRQLDLKEEKTKATKKEKWQSMAPRFKSKGYSDDEEASSTAEQIAQVHSIESSRKGASSAVDPK
jgi:hypothetical protein